MDAISRLARKFSENARRKRAELFRSFFVLGAQTRILDLGSEDGSNIHNVLAGTGVKPHNVFIADIDRHAVESGHKRYGYTPVNIEEGSGLGFDNQVFDIVYCSSVIEHVTVPKAELWNYTNEKRFSAASWKSQKTFAAEIARLGRQYFVQTPCSTFPLESHTWLPFIGYLPRQMLLPVLKISNRYWVKAAEPDFHLLDYAKMRTLFPNAQIVLEKKYGLTKSVMAINSDRDHGNAINK